MLESDVAGEREDRRAEAGYVAPKTAASSSPRERGQRRSGDRSTTPVTRAYFRGLRKTPRAEEGASAPARRRRLRELLTRRGSRRRGPLHASWPPDRAAPRASPRWPPRCGASSEEDPARFARSAREELAFLTNVLVPAALPGPAAPPGGGRRGGARDVQHRPPARGRIKGPSPKGRLGRRGMDDAPRSPRRRAVPPRVGPSGPGRRPSPPRAALRRVLAPRGASSNLAISSMVGGFARWASKPAALALANSPPAA